MGLFTSMVGLLVALPGMLLAALSSLALLFGGLMVGLLALVVTNPLLFFVLVWAVYVGVGKNAEHKRALEAAALPAQDRPRPQGPAVHVRFSPLWFVAGLLALPCAIFLLLL